MNGIVNLMSAALSMLVGATGTTAIAAAIAGLTGVAAAIAMGLIAYKSVDGIARQPEADKKIRSAMMLGLAFAETTAIYGVLVAILIMVL